MSNKLFEGLIKVFPNLKSVSIKLFSNIKKIEILPINVKNETNIVDKKTLYIGWSKLKDTKRKELLELLPPALKEGTGIINNTDSEKLQSTKETYDNAIKNSLFDEVNYFKDKIPDEDTYILKAAIIIHQEFRKGKCVDILKSDIRYRYGQRGVNICNLYSSGYFSSLIKPLYENMLKQVDFYRQKFVDAYNIIIEHSPSAIFINRRMSKPQIKAIIYQKIKESSKYGVSVINVHGIGGENIDNITSVIKDVCSELRLPYEIELKNGLFDAKIKIK